MTAVSCSKMAEPTEMPLWICIELGGPRNNVLGSSQDLPQGTGQFLGISPGWLWSKGNIRRESESFGRWQQRCSLSLSILQLLLLLLHPFNGLFSSTTLISRYQKGKTSLDLNDARGDGVLGCSGISWTICKQSALRCRQITTPAPHDSIFTGRMRFLMPNQQCLSTDATAATCFYSNLGPPFCLAVNHIDQSVCSLTLQRKFCRKLSYIRAISFVRIASPDKGESHETRQGSVMTLDIVQNLESRQTSRLLDHMLKDAWSGDG